MISDDWMTIKLNKKYSPCVDFVYSNYILMVKPPLNVITFVTYKNTCYGAAVNTGKRSTNGKMFDASKVYAFRSKQGNKL